MLEINLLVTYENIIFTRKALKMDKKLTLSLNGAVIDKAKIYAKSNETSLSKLIEAYLSTLTERNRKEIEITPLVESLSGVITLEKDFDEKKEYANYLIEKYK